MTRGFLFSILAGLVLAACSDSIEVLSGATSSSSSLGGGGGVAAGTGGASGSTGSSGPASTGTGGSGGCPDLINDGDPCSTEGQTCQVGPGGCCGPSIATCTGGKWQIIPGGCPAFPCPDTLPADGSSCACQGMMKQCRYDKCQTATCMGQESMTWSVVQSSCSVPCGPGLACTGGQVCVASMGPAGTQYACAPFPCGPNALSCECAQSLCGTDPWVCTSASQGQVDCTCQACP